MALKAKIKLIQNATDLKDNEETKKVAKEIIKKYNIKNEKILINIGRLSKIKNLDFVIDVCKELKDRNFNFKLFILGSGIDENYFKKKVSYLNLNKNVIFVGRVSSLSRKGGYFSVSDLHIFPSFYDTDGIVRIEAAAFKVPTLFIKDSFASSACTNNVNGLIVENSIISFADKIIEVLNDKEFHSSLSSNAYRDLYLTWDMIVKQVYSIYLEFIKSKNY